MVQNEINTSTSLKDVPEQYRTRIRVNQKNNPRESVSKNSFSSHNTSIGYPSITGSNKCPMYHELKFSSGTDDKCDDISMMTNANYSYSGTILSSNDAADLGCGDSIRSTKFVRHIDTSLLEIHKDKEMYSTPENITVININSPPSGGTLTQKKVEASLSTKNGSTIESSFYNDSVWSNMTPSLRGIKTNMTSSITDSDNSHNPKTSKSFISSLKQKMSKSKSNSIYSQLPKDQCSSQIYLLNDDASLNVKKPLNSNYCTAANTMTIGRSYMKCKQDQRPKFFKESNSKVNMIVLEKRLDYEKKLKEYRNSVKEFEETLKKTSLADNLIDYDYYREKSDSKLLRWMKSFNGKFETLKFQNKKSNQKQPKHIASIRVNDKISTIKSNSHFIENTLTNQNHDYISKMVNSKLYLTESRKKFFGPKYKARKIVRRISTIFN
ncbi:hypothetical protein A3Q56_02967 [Intoshia linei]|uniref:Uncharacterized protein n=1 Tax=Intoshia linei TaxID=1819745 RepID=A0A177B777_9BILA|nr:hypothetical protein A3Q56_02967 [Intoshia linei]